MQVSEQISGSLVLQSQMPRTRARVRVSVAERLRQWFYGVAYALKPSRISAVPAVLALTARHALGLGSKRGVLPNPDSALRHPDGLAGICTDMSVTALRDAYARGLFPWSHIGPQKWWAPRERMALFIENFRVEKTIRRRLRQEEFSVTFDRDFAGVVQACAEPRPGRVRLTWIRPEMIEAYSKAFDAGLAHSVEVWNEAGELVGGAYGLSVGRVFFTELQFTRQRDASKVGFAVLNCHLQRWGYVLNDGKHLTGYLSQLGFSLVPRAAFNALLAKACQEPGREGQWFVEPGLDVARWEPKAGMCQPTRSRQVLL